MAHTRTPDARATYRERQLTKRARTDHRRTARALKRAGLAH